MDQSTFDLKLEIMWIELMKKCFDLLRNKRIFISDSFTLKYPEITQKDPRKV